MTDQNGVRIIPKRREPEKVTSEDLAYLCKLVVEMATDYARRMPFEEPSVSSASFDREDWSGIAYVDATERGRRKRFRYEVNFDDDNDLGSLTFVQFLDS